MAITVDWPNKIINVPKADMQVVQNSPTEILQLDIDAFRLTLKSLEASEEGMPWLDTHSHNPPVTVGGVTLARVIEIINGYTVTFEDDQYAVNLVGANSNIADVTNVNQVSVRSANSAGLTFSDQINDQSFGGYVSLNVDEGQSGTQFPRGTLTDPVNNWADAAVIAAERKLHEVHLLGTLIPEVSPSDDLSQFTIQGINALSATVVLGGQMVDQVAFRNIQIAGTQGYGYCTLRDCITGNLVDLECGMLDCVLNGTTYVLKAVPDSAFDISFFDCVSGIPGATKPNIDCNGTTSDIQIRRYAGGVQISNFTSGNNMSIDMTSGSVQINSSCTAGTIVVRGVGDLIDNSGAGCTVISTGLLDADKLDDLWKLSGLDIQNPMTVTPTSRDAGSIAQAITGDGETTTTVTRTS